MSRRVAPEAGRLTRWTSLVGRPKILVITDDLRSGRTLSRPFAVRGRKLFNWLPGGIMDQPPPQEVLHPVRATFRAMGASVLPPDASLADRDWDAIETIVDEALAGRPAAVGRQIRLFLRVVNLLPIPTTGRTLTRLPLDQRTAFLDRLQRSRLALLRRGIWGVRTFLFMGYYTQDRIRQKIGYSASAAGWEAVRPAEKEETAP